MNLDDIVELSVLIREVEFTLLDLFAKGKLNGTVHTCIGQEYTGAVLRSLLTDSDVVFSNHRCHGHYIGKTDDVEGLLLEILGSERGVVQGIGGSQHLYNDKGFFSNGILAGMSPVAAGYSFTLRNSKDLVCLFIGDGALGEGIFYETLGLVRKFELPMVIIVEDNGYSQSTPTATTFNGSLKKRIESFDIEYFETNIWDLDRFLQDTSHAFQKVRDHRLPVLLHVHCYRLMAHSKGDDSRDAEEVESFVKRDPLNIFEVSESEKYRQYVVAAKKRIQFCLDSNKSIENRVVSVETIEDTVDSQWKSLNEFSGERINTLIYQALYQGMINSQKIVIVGEDIEYPYGGAFNVTRDLSRKFPSRVFNMPNSESGIMGFGNGMSLGGLLPICEIMFGDFLALTFDQWINHAAKFSSMYASKIVTPVILRAPMGGRRGYGPTHSQNLEKHFLGIPNTQVLCLNSRYNPRLLYSSLLDTIEAPTLVVENKLDYPKFNSITDSNAGYNYFSNQSLFPELKFTNEEHEADLTLVCWGGLVETGEAITLELAYEEEIYLDMIVPQKLFPLNVKPIADSVAKTKMLVIIEDDTSFGSLGSELAFSLLELGLNFRVHKIATRNDIIPSSTILETLHYPSNEQIYRSIKSFFLS